jgi:glycosyltransferase involved in cell wall biosynthesis
MAMQTLQLARLLREEGVQVEVLQTNAPYRPACVEKLRGVRALFRLLPYLFQVWGLCRRSDVIHLMANSGWSWQLFAAPVLWIAWLHRTPVIVNYRGGEAREYLSRAARWVKPSLDRAASLVVPSGFLRQVFSDFGVSARVIPNVVDLDTFSPVPARPAGDEFTLVVTRNLEPIYGLDTALRALALAREREPGLRLDIAGSGPARGELQALAAQLGLGDQVRFLGRLERAEVVELYRRADAMLNPTRVDNMPNSVLEALACGLPVISTNVGGVPYIVEDGVTALLVEPDQPRVMAEAMVRLCRDCELRGHLREQGPREVAQYAWRHIGGQWLQLYRDAGAMS